MTRGASRRLAWTGTHGRYKKSNAIYKETYEKIFKKNKNNKEKKQCTLTS